MKKTQDISKYEIEWQLTRSHIKGHRIPIMTKLILARNYFLETKSYDRWERVYNWLEGLHKGYHTPNSIAARVLVSQELLMFNRFRSICVCAVSLNSKHQEFIIKTTPEKELIYLWCDLFKTNEKWLSRGYFHKECNSLLDTLLLNIRRQSIPNRYSAERLKNIREESSLTKNTHKFFF